MPDKLTIRTLAQNLKLAPSTVSDALRGTGRVNKDTVKRVRERAKSLGYQPNPLTSTVLSEVRRLKGPRYRGVIATLDIHESTHWPHGPFPRELLVGARLRAAEIGFSIAEFIVGGSAMSIGRLDTVLKSRGIHGIIVLPSWAGPDLSELDWPRYAGIYTDSGTTTPVLHSVCPDHYGSMLRLLKLLADRGYRKPGLIMEHGRDQRIQHRQTAAFRAFQVENTEIEPVPILITPEAPAWKEDFKPWFARHQPDVLLSHFAQTPDWIKACGVRSTKKYGFVLLNVIERRVPSAGLDLQPRLLGARAAEMVVGQLLRNELGIPAWPSRNMIEARWVEGPTVRAKV